MTEKEKLWQKIQQTDEALAKLLIEVRRVFGKCSVQNFKLMGDKQ